MQLRLGCVGTKVLINPQLAYFSHIHSHSVLRLPTFQKSSNSLKCQFKGKLAEEEIKSVSFSESTERSNKSKVSK